MSNAQGYHIVIYRDGFIDQKVVDKKIKGTSYTLKESELAMLDNGTYVWFVTGIEVVKGQSVESKKSERKFFVNVEDAGKVELDISDLLH